MWSDLTLFYELKCEGGGGFQNYVLCLKFVRIMVEASNWHVNTHSNLVSKIYIFEYQGPLIFANVIIRLLKISVF